MLQRLGEFDANMKLLTNARAADCFMNVPRVGKFIDKIKVSMSLDHLDLVSTFVAPPLNKRNTQNIPKIPFALEDRNNTTIDDFQQKSENNEQNLFEKDEKKDEKFSVGFTPPFKFWLGGVSSGSKKRS